MANQAPIDKTTIYSSHSTEQEMRYYDSLPAGLRALYQQTSIRFSALEALILLGRGATEQQIIAHFLPAELAFLANTQQKIWGPDYPIDIPPIKEPTNAQAQEGHPIGNPRKATRLALPPRLHPKRQPGSKRR